MRNCFACGKVIQPTEEARGKMVLPIDREILNLKYSDAILYFHFKSYSLENNCYYHWSIEHRKKRHQHRDKLS